MPHDVHARLAWRTRVSKRTEQVKAGSARAPRSGSGRRISCVVMEQGKVTDVTMLVAELRERVRALDARVIELGRHL